jgi:hypothetical protein
MRFGRYGSRLSQRSLLTPERSRRSGAGHYSPPVCIRRRVVFAASLVASVATVIGVVAATEAPQRYCDELGVPASISLTHWSLAAAAIGLGTALVTSLAGQMDRRALAAVGVLAAVLVALWAIALQMIPSSSCG